MGRIVRGKLVRPWESLPGQKSPKLKINATVVGHIVASKSSASVAAEDGNKGGVVRAEAGVEEAGAGAGLVAGEERRGDE